MILPPDDASRRGAFASMVAHELRTPLTAAYGALEMLARGATAALTPDSARTAVLLDLAHRNTQRLLRIVEDCLDLEAASDGRLTLARAAGSTAEVVALGVQGARSAIEQTGIEVVSRLETQRCFTGDAARLGRALAHLVQNAVTFAPPGTEVLVTATEDEEQGTIRFTVEDRGAGLDPVQMQTLFQQFDIREAIGRSRIGGLGIGLAYVLMVAEEHGGAVAVESVPGRTRIGFELPVRG